MCLLVPQTSFNNSDLVYCNHDRDDCQYYHNVDVIVGHLARTHIPVVLHFIYTKNVTISIFSKFPTANDTNMFNAYVEATLNDPKHNFYGIMGRICITFKQ